MTTKYYHLSDENLQEVYDVLTDEQKLTLCLRDYRVSSINKVAHRLGIDTDAFKQSFQDEYDELLDNVAVEYQLDLEEDLVRAVELADVILEECADWMSWMFRCDIQDITNYLNSREDD